MELTRALRLVVVTDRALAAPRAVSEVVAAALRGGARAVQLRDKHASARDLVAQATVLRTLTREAGALLFVNDRVDVALAADADGAHVGPSDLPIDALRPWLPSGFLLGYSADDPDEARRAEAAGVDYIGCGAVFGTTSKDVGDEAIGTARLAAVARAVTIPVVAIGGITPANVASVAATPAAGVAVLGAVMSAPDPETVTTELLAPFQERRNARPG